MRLRWAERKGDSDQGLKTGGSAPINSLTPTQSLRDILRTQTRASHDQLDTLIRRTGWDTRPGYVAFLQLQYLARLPIENWFARNGDAAKVPPSQTELIRQDLVRLDAKVPVANTSGFKLPRDASPIGAFWAISGSTLGNKMIARDARRAMGSDEWPLSFLSDRSMSDYWAGLKCVLDESVRPEDANRTVASAIAVFEHFQRTASQFLYEEAA